jgi:heme-degrading monooxygenase HmoA
VPFVSVTRLRLRSWRFLPGFLVHTVRSQRQLRRAEGYLTGRLAAGAGRTFWTITLWDSEASMRAYRNAGAHMRAMPKLIEWCDEAAIAHWEQAGVELPSVEQATERLAGEGRLSKVRNPSPAHSAGSRWPDGVLPSAGPPLPPRNQGGRNRGES